MNLHFYDDRVNFLRPLAVGTKCLLSRKLNIYQTKRRRSLIKSSDIQILPYKSIYQSNGLFLSCSFGLPVIATDVGSLKENIVEGKTGMICQPEDPHHLADTISGNFGRELFRNLQFTVKYIMDYGNRKYSWEEVVNITCGVYNELIDDRRGEQSIN
jgi:glycosyltransferase involved in cell wall biosynthesis